MKKKILILLTLIISLTCLFSSCQNKNIGGSVFTEPIYEWGKIRDRTISIWCKSKELDRLYMKKAFSRYESITGNKIVINNINADKLDETLKTELDSPYVAGTGMDMMLNFGGANLDKFNPTETLYDLSNEIWVNEITLQALTQSIYDGKLVGLPHTEASISGTLYNKKLFKKYNIALPTNQQEFLNVCDTFLSHGITPLFLPYAEITMLLYQFPMDSIVKNSDVLNGINDSSLSYNEIPEMSKILDWYKTMSDNGYLGSDYQKNDWDGMDPAMKSEKYAMMNCWDTWLYTDFTGNPADFGIMPAFMGVPDEGTYEGANMSILSVNKKSTNIDAALDLLTFLADPYNYNVAFDRIYTSAVFRNQEKSISTPQSIEMEKSIKRLYHDSTAGLRIRGFSQMDAKFIQKYMSDTTGNYTKQKCLEEMDNARIQRIRGRLPN